ncbi:Replication factor C small subunit [Bienertia sinuspersici]
MMAELFDRQFGKKAVGKPHQGFVHPVPKAINCFEAVQKYGGVKICEVYDKKQPIRNNKFYNY